MICAPCRTGGLMNQTGQAHMFRRLLDGAVVTIDNPAAMHDLCEYPTNCPCQHRVGTYVIRPAN